MERGGTLRYGVLGDARTLDPYGRRSTFLTWAIARSLYRSLYRTLPDGTVEPDLAASLEATPDGVRVRLAPARWSDGTRVSARDVVASVRRARPPSGYARLEARAASRGVVELIGNMKDAGTRLATGTFVLPARRGGRRFSGPFVVARTVPGLKIVLERNPFWAGDEPVLDRIVVTHVSSLRTMIELLDRGRLNAAWPPSSVNMGERLETLEIPFSSAIGRETVYLYAASLSRPQRAWVADQIDLEGLAEGLIRDDGRLLEPAPAARPERPAGPLRLTVPAGDELLALLAQNLQVQIGPREPTVEIAVAEPAVVYGGGEGDPGGIKVVRGFGRPPAGAIALFEVASYVAFREGVTGMEVNPTIEGPLWNAQRWALER